MNRFALCLTAVLAAVSAPACADQIDDLMAVGPNERMTDQMRDELQVLDAKTRQMFNDLNLKAAIYTAKTDLAPPETTWHLCRAAMNLDHLQGSLASKKDEKSLIQRYHAGKATLIQYSQCLESLDQISKDANR